MIKDLAFFGFAPRLTGEDSVGYFRLLKSIYDEVQPTDIFERIWTRELADLIWETFRWRGLMVNLIIATEQEALQCVLRPLVGALRLEQADALAWRYRVKEPGAAEEVQRLLEKAGLTWDAVKAEALSLRIDDVERFNHMIVSAEKRRDATLQEIERRRATFGQKLPRAVKQVEGADYRLLEEKPANESRAA